MWEFWKAAGLTVAPIAGGFINGMLFSPRSNASTEDWYKNKLIKPSFTPPGWVFGPVWTTLYGMMGYASYRILSQASSGTDVSVPLTAYALQLTLNMTWTPVYFGYRKLFLSVVVINGTLGALIWTIKEFTAVDDIAAKLLWPYLAWLSFACVLNTRIYTLNRNNSSLKSE